MHYFSFKLLKLFRNDYGFEFYAEFFGKDIDIVSIDINISRKIVCAVKHLDYKKIGTVKNSKKE
jgi:hypothetical protein